MKIMRKFSLTLLTLAMALTCQTFSSHASTATAAATPASGGVTLALSTSGFSFTPLIGVLLPPPGTTKPAPLPPQGFSAAVTLLNNTTAAIPCTLGVTGTPGEKFVFTVYDSNGNVVWNSLPAVTMPLELLTTLPAATAWHGSVFVPLFIKGKALLPGTYTLQASLYGSPVFTATTSFVVKNVIAIN